MRRVIQFVFADHNTDHPATELNGAETMRMRFQKMKEENWLLYQTYIDEMEQKIDNCQDLRIVFDCHDINEVTERFLFRMLKVIERYKWACEKDIKITWIFQPSCLSMVPLIRKLKLSFEIPMDFHEISAN